MVQPPQPVNKDRPDDWKKKQDAAALVQKIKREKKERERAMQEKFKKHDERIAAEIAERNRVAQEKEQDEQIQKERKRMELE